MGRGERRTRYTTPDIWVTIGMEGESKCEYDEWDGRKKIMTHDNLY